MKRIAAAIFLSFFFLLRPFLMQYDGLLYPNDDFDYFAHATSLTFGQFPSYKNEYIMRGTSNPLEAIGPGIIATPFVFAFSLLDRINGSDIVKKRTIENVPRSWAVYGFIFASVFYFCLSCMLLYWAVSSLVGPSFAAWAIILMVICQGMPIYACRRPVFSHVSEFFLQSIFVYLFTKNEIDGGKWIKQWWSFVLLGSGAALILLTRYNNFLFAFMWPLFFIGRRDKYKNKKDVLFQCLWVIAPFVSLVGLFLIWPLINNKYMPYENFLSYLSAKASIVGILNRIIHIFVGYDWGLIFTAPFLLLGIAGLGLLDIRIKKRFILACLPLLVNLYTIIFWSGGGYYGYRYLIASALPLLVIPLAFLLKWLEGKIGPWWKWGAVFLALLPVMSMWCYEGNALVSTHVIPVFFGKADWSNATYQIAVWQTVFNLEAFWKIIFLGGIQYCYYLFNVTKVLFGSRSYLPFEVKTLIQVFLIYSLPLVMAWVFRDKSPTVDISPKKSFKVPGIFLIAIVGLFFISMKWFMPHPSHNIEIDPENAQAFNSRGIGYYNQGNLTKALSDYNQAIAINPHYAQVYYNRAVIYYKLKEYERAWEDVNKMEALGVIINPEFISALKRTLGKDK